ncbi:hypothetical protein LEMA_P059320.1 [Plenodomus lingam JN3]|uniref:CoA-binding domain-containing protein n=1 Tax=Leptosphaeria maculans (strain JN3 / isolate v23.1.3 / race Av1-4-5-6-7-8) TaxID=985895 RepID=E4ZHR5_LEPMJ|nr:hypothetical protein LEMA_P059320.1 [Plenodomus lingam JN3]CBX90898.1 hypothetical protein LEMA_P059320.1 [Plenodomus lingam JN3]
MRLSDDATSEHTSVSKAHIICTVTISTSDQTDHNKNQPQQRVPQFPNPHMPTTRSQNREADMEAALKTFFSSPRFAVAGASSDPNKYGHKIFAWYLRHSLPVTPINPRVPTVNILQREHTTVASPKALTDPPASAYSLSVITPPAVTWQLLKEAKEAGVPAVWLQPGSFDDEVLAYARANFEAAIGGDGGGGTEGWCVLVDGEEGLKLAGREWSRL